MNKRKRWSFVITKTTYYEELPSIVSFYDAKSETINYAYANLSDFLAKNPGARAKSFSVKNYPVEPLCHFWRCYTSGMADHEEAGKIAFFADEKAKKLIVAHNIDDDDSIFSAVAKFIELCDKEPAVHEGLSHPVQEQTDVQYIPSTALPKEAVAGIPQAEMKHYYVGDLVARTDGEVDFDTLADLIRETIDPDGWADGESENGNTITPMQKSLGLIIKAPKDTHEFIAKLLAQLREQ